LTYSVYYTIITQRNVTYKDRLCHSGIYRQSIQKRREEDITKTHHVTSIV